MHVFTYGAVCIAIFSNFVFVVVICRINKIIFRFSLSTFFRDHIIEDEASVHAQFDIQITLMNDLYSSMTMNIDLDSRLVRYCGDFKAGVTVVDILIIVVVLLSAGAYGRSVIKAYRMAKVVIT